MDYSKYAGILNEEMHTQYQEDHPDGSNKSRILEVLPHFMGDLQHVNKGLTTEILHDQMDNVIYYLCRYDPSKTKYKDYIRYTSTYLWIKHFKSLKRESNIFYSNGNIRLDTHPVDFDEPNWEFVMSTLTEDEQEFMENILEDCNVVNGNITNSLEFPKTHGMTRKAFNKKRNKIFEKIKRRNDAS